MTQLCGTKRQGIINVQQWNAELVMKIIAMGNHKEDIRIKENNKLQRTRVYCKDYSDNDKVLG